MSQSSRESILNKLRAARPILTTSHAPSERLRVTPLSDTSPAALRALFIERARAVQVEVFDAASHAEALAHILSLIADDQRVIRWDDAYLPLPGLPEALTSRGISAADAYDGDARIGLTGTDAALAATGSLVVRSGAGRPRTASLLPPVHIALIESVDILPDLEAYFERVRARGLENLREAANVAIITGSSRTADIGQELILGAHGPIMVHAVILP
jgi:L-lactate dehydrogenase complex protein LldG